MLNAERLVTHSLAASRVLCPIQVLAFVLLWPVLHGRDLCSYLGKREPAKFFRYGIQISCPLSISVFVSANLISIKYRERNLKTLPRSGQLI